MSAPFLRGTSPMVQTTGTSLTIPLPSRNDGDLVILVNQGFNFFGTNAGKPNLPGGWHEIYGAYGAAEWHQAAWKRISTAKGSGRTGSEPDPVLTAGPGQLAGAGWYGHAEVYGNVDFRDPGWLDLPGGSGNRATVTRADFGAITELAMSARVSFDALAATNWVAGYANGDAGFGLNSSNRLVFFVNNTLGNPIGNGQSTVGIPGLLVNQKVWIQASLTASSATVVYRYSFDDVEDVRSVHWADLGTPVVGTNAGTTMRVTNTDTLFLGTKDAATASMAGKLYSFAENTGFFPISNIVFSNPDPAGFALAGTATVLRPTSDLGTSSPIEDWGYGNSSTFSSGVYAPARRVYGTGRLIQTTWLGGSFTAQYPNPITGPSGWQVLPDRSAQFGGFYVKDVLRIREADADTADAPVSTTGDYAYSYFGATIRGLEDPARPPAEPQPERLLLGCADSYTVWVTDGSYNERLEVMRWSQLEWERVLDDTSQASVTIPDELGGLNCLTKVTGLLPWKYGILIERNDHSVWRGPVITVGRRANTLVVTAADVLARYQKRFAIRDEESTYTNVDAGVMFRDIANTHAMLPSDLWSMPVPNVTVGVPITRTLKPRELKYAYDLLSELADTAVDMFVRDGVMYVWEPNAGWRYQAVIKRSLEGPYNANYDMVFGMFTEEAWAKRPDWTIDGAGQANYVAVPAADSGEWGYRTIGVAESLSAQQEFGVLDLADPDPLEVPEDTSPPLITQSLVARAKTVAALRAYAPAVLEGGTLSVNAPVDVDHLLPGTIWVADVWDSGFTQILAAGRVRRITVSVNRGTNGITESVSAVLEPLGWEGEV